MREGDALFSVGCIMKGYTTSQVLGVAGSQVDAGNTALQVFCYLLQCHSSRVTQHV